MTKQQRVVKMLQELADGLRKHENYRIKQLHALTLHSEWSKKERKLHPNSCGEHAYLNDVPQALEHIIQVLTRPSYGCVPSHPNMVHGVRVQPKTKSKITYYK